MRVFLKLTVMFSLFTVNCFLFCEVNSFDDSHVKWDRYPKDSQEHRVIVPVDKISL